MEQKVEKYRGTHGKCLRNKTRTTKQNPQGLPCGMSHIDYVEPDIKEIL